MKKHVLHGLAVGLLPAVLHAAPIDFLQVDGGRETATLVLVKALRFSADNPAPPLLSAVYSYFSTGDTGNVAYTHRWAASPAGPHALTLGLGVGANSYRNKDRPDEDETGVSLRGQAEAAGPAPGGTYYALLQASTFRDAWFGLIQYTPGGLPVGLEMYRQYQEGYQATTTALRFRTGLDNWLFRVGVVRTSEEYRPFVGLTFNAF